MKKISIKAVTAGVLFSLLGIFLFGILILEIIVIKEGLQSETINQRWGQISHTLGMLIVFSIVGTLLDFMSGVITGLIAKGAELVNASMVGIISLLFGLGLSLTTTSTYPIWFTLTGYLVTVPATIAGGMVSMKINESGYSFAKYKKELNGINFILFLLLLKIISFAVVSLRTEGNLIYTYFEISFGLLVVIGLLRRNNYGRIALIGWLSLETLLRIPDLFSSLSRADWAEITSIIIFIVIRFIVISYMFRKAVKLKFVKAGNLEE